MLSWAVLRWTLATWCLAGCDLVFQVELPGPTSAGTCVVASDPFDMSNPEAWQTLDTASPVAVTVDSGSLLFALDPGQTAYNGLASTVRRDLRAGGVIVELVQAPTSEGFGDITAHLTGNSGAYFVGVYGSGPGVPLVTYYGEDSNWSEVEFDATAHRFWRLLGAGDRIELDAGPDGVAWNLLAIIPATGLDDVTIVLRGGVWGFGGPASDSARIDNFQLLSTSCVP